MYLYRGVTNCKVYFERRFLTMRRARAFADAVLLRVVDYRIERRPALSALVPALALALALSLPAAAFALDADGLSGALSPESSVDYSGSGLPDGAVPFLFSEQFYTEDGVSCHDVFFYYCDEGVDALLLIWAGGYGDRVIAFPVRGGAYAGSSYAMHGVWPDGVEYADNLPVVDTDVPFFYAGDDGFYDAVSASVLGGVPCYFADVTGTELDKEPDYIADKPQAYSDYVFSNGLLDSAVRLGGASDGGSPGGGGDAGGDTPASGVLRVTVDELSSFDLVQLLGDFVFAQWFQIALLLMVLGALVYVCFKPIGR